MGIRGLQRFMTNNGCCEQVRLSDIAEAYRNKTGKDPVLLIDYASSIPFFYTASPGIKTVIGELKKFKENLKNFVNNCKELGIELKIFSEGKRPPYKYRKWLESITQKAKDLREIYSLQKIADSSIFNKAVLFWSINSYMKLHDNCKFIQAIYEADSDIINYLKMEDCFALMTNDSDFLAEDNVHYCLTPQNFNLESMTFFNFNRFKLAELLKINPSQLPLFAALCLNDFSHPDLLNLYKQMKINMSNRFFQVAELIRKFTSKEELVEYIFSSNGLEVATCLERSLKFFCGEEQKDVRRHTVINHWAEIVNFAEERHITGKAAREILSIIQDKVVFLGVSCENIFKPLPVNAASTLRKKIYGILFFEHPNSLIFVTEISYDRNAAMQEGLLPKAQMRTVIVDRRSHPGLMTLWSPEKSDSLNISRQTVFCETINDKLTAKAFSSLNIPMQYIFPILTVFYFLWELDKKVEEFEVETILIQAVLANRLTWEQIEQLPEEFNTEALELTAWFLVIIKNLMLLNEVCGAPFCKQKTNVANYFDGKVLQYVYGKLKKGEDPWTCFNEYKKEYETLISELYELGRICGHVETNEKRGSLLNGNSTNW